MSCPDGGIPRRRHHGSAMLLALFVKHLLQIGTILDELIGLEIASPPPDLLESIYLTHSEVAGPATADPCRQFFLVCNEIPVPNHSGRRGLVLLEEDFRASRRQRGIRDRHHAGAEHLGDAVSSDDVASFQLLGHVRRSARRAGQSATVSADLETLAASCFSVLRKLTGSEVNFWSAA